MIRLSKKVEYAIVAVQYMALKPGQSVSVKEISDGMNISFDFLSKAMQKLLKYHIVESHQGIKGGYKLAKKAEEIKIIDIINAMEQSGSIVECFSIDDNNCNRMDFCTIRHSMGNIQKMLDTLFYSTSVAEFLPGSMNNT